MIEAIVIGVSAGGMKALSSLLSGLPREFPVPIAIVQHVAAQSDSYFIDYLSDRSPLVIKEAEDKEPLRAGHAYLAPAGYHLLIDPDRTFSLSVDARVNFSCPSIDVLFESAADVFGENLAGLVLTGASADGSRGLKTIKALGGLAIVQNPGTAEHGYMPHAAMSAARVDYVADLDRIPGLLIKLSAFEREIS